MYIYAYICIYAYIWMHVYMYIYAYICMHVYMCIYAYICMLLYMHVYMHIYMYAWGGKRIYVYIDVYTHDESVATETEATFCPIRSFKCRLSIFRLTVTSSCAPFTLTPRAYGCSQPLSVSTELCSDSAHSRRVTVTTLGGLVREGGLCLVVLFTHD